MSDIEDFADWLVANQALKGTPRFKAVADAFTELDTASTPVAPVKPADTGFTGAFKGAYQGIKGEAALTAGKLGLMSLHDAQNYYEEQKKKQAEVFQPTTEGWGTAPWQKFKETLGGSLPYMVAPVAGAVAGAVAAPELAVAGLGAAALGSLAGGTAQFTGTGLARQMETGKNLEETNLGYAVGAAIPSAALDTISLRMTPFLGQLFRKAGIEVSEKETQEIVKKNLLSTVGEYAAQGVKLAGIEGATEAGQAVFERLQAGLSLTDKSAVDEYIENFIGGAVLGGALGTAGHAASKAFAPKAGEAIVAPSVAAPVEAPVAPVEPVAAPVATPVAESAPATTPVVEPETAVETPVAAKAEVFTVEDPVAKAGIHKEFNSLEEAEAHVDNLAANRTELIAEHQSNVDATNADIATLQKGLDTEVAKGNYGTPQFLTHENNINNEIGALTTKAVQEQALIDNLSQPVQIVSPTNAVVEVKAVQATPIAPTPITPAPAPLQAVTEPVTKIATEYAPDLAGKMATLQKTLLPTLKKFGLDKVGLRIVESIADGKADASYVKQIMKIAYDTEDHMGVLRHESIHALKELGAFADNEWKVLTKKAQTEWIDRFIRQPNLYTGYQEQYEANNGSLDGFDAYMQEEAIAEAFRHFAKTKPPAGLIGQLYSRLNNMFQSLGNSFKQLGYTNADAIFQKIERGDAKPKKVEKVAEKVAEKPVKVKKAPEAKKVVEKAPEALKAPEVAEKIAEKPEAHTGTMETNTLLNKQGKEANEEYDNIKDIDKPWAKELVKRFENIQRKVFTSLSAGTINRLASTVVGEKVRVGKTDTQAFGTFDGKASPNMRIPMSYMTEDNVEHNFTKEQAELMLVVLGTNLNQEAQAASLFTPVETGADTFRIRLDNKILNERDAAAFDKAIGYPVNVYQDENGHGIIDINLAGNDPFTSEEALKSAMGKVFPNAEYAFTPCKYESIYITSEQSDYSDKSYKEIVNEWKKGESTGGTRNGLWKTFDVDFKPSVTEIRNLATARNKEFKEFAQEARRRQEIEKKVVEPEVKAPVKKSELEAIWNSYRHTALPFSSLSKEDIQVLARVKDKDDEVIDRAVQKIYKAIEQAPTEAEVEAVAAQEIDTKEVAQEEEEVQPEEEEEPQAKTDKAPRGRFQFKEYIPATLTEKFKRWFGNSEIVNRDGTPKVMYHATARDITIFTPKQANAIFLTDSPDFAQTFAETSEDFMIAEAKANMSEAELDSLRAKAEKISKKEGTSYADELYALIRDTLPSNQNIMPVYVSAKNVFDFENPAHLHILEEAGIIPNDNTPSWLAATLDEGKTSTRQGTIERVKIGSWNAIESESVQAAIKKAGFDGFYVLEGGKKNLGVYTSNQIKSAIGNNGEFDINNPDIRYKLRTPAAPVTDAPPKELTKLTPAQTLGRQIKDAAVEVQTAWNSNDFWTNLRQTWVDPSSALAQSLSGKGAWDLKGLRADMLHRAKSQIINVINNGLQIGTAKLNKDGSIIIERSENNLARSQILADKLDANPFVQATGLTGRKFVSEIARALRGEEIIADDTKRKAQAVKDLAEARKMFKDSKDLPYKEKAKVRREAANLRKQGIENKNINRELQVTPEQIAWAKKQLQSVPEVEEVFVIWRNVNNSLLDLWHDTGLLNKTQLDEYRSKKRYVPMFASKEDLNEQMFGALGFSGAKSVKDVQRLRGSELDRNIWENMYKNYATKISAAYENQTRRVAVQQLVEVGAAEISTATDKRVNLRFKDYNHPDADANGVVHALVYNTNDVLAFQNMHYELTPLMKGFSKMTNILRTGALLNPMFWIRQLIRDPIHAAIVTDSGIVTPFHAAKEFINILKNDSREFSILFERGVVGPRDSTLDYHDYLTQIGQEKADTSTFRNALHKIEMMHEASDAATRVSIFKDAEAKALKQGMSAEDAINFAVYKSRESINFSVHGNGKMLNNIRHMIPFFSASITSLDTVYRAATGYGLPPAEKAAAQKMFKQRAGAMLVMSAAYAMMMQGDDEYEKLPDHVKDGNWLVPNPLGTGFINIAVPFEVGFLFKTIPETAVRYMAGTSTGKEVLASYQAGIIQNMPGNLVPLPQAVRPLFEAITNYSFFTGETIETAGDAHLPTAFRGANASELAKVLSKFGLDSIGLSPTKIDYLTQGFMAELGITGMALASQAVLAAEGKTSPDTNLEKLPFFKAFMTDPNADKAVSDFYKIEQNAVKVHTEFQKMLKSGMGKEAIEYLKEGNNQKIIAYEPSLIKMSKQLGTIRAAINVTTNNQSMSPEDRRLQINNLKKVYNNVADAYAKVAKSID